MSVIIEAINVDSNLVAIIGEAFDGYTLVEIDGNDSTSDVMSATDTKIIVNYQGTLPDTFSVTVTTPGGTDTQSYNSVPGEDTEKVHFFHNTFYSIVVGLLKEYKGFIIKRYNKDGSVKKQVEVPIRFGNLDKLQTQRELQGDTYYQKIPRMALTFSGMSYGSDRSKSAKTNRYHKEDGNYHMDIEPTPWDFLFELKIKAKNVLDLAQIMEQILPYYNNKKSIQIKEVPASSKDRDLNVTIDGVSPTFPEEYDDNSLRYVFLTISLKVEGVLWRPFHTAEEIKQIDVNFEGKGFSENISIS